MKTRRDYARLGSAIAALTLGVVLMFVAEPRSRADDRAACQQRIERAEVRLQEEIREHGERSPQADHQRHELNEERERCWNEHHGWWHGGERQWHNERDWDRDRDEDNRATCRRRVELAEDELWEEIREHGEYSPQADRRRRELNEERERCWNEHHGWWSAGERQWHNERDWDLFERYTPTYQSGFKEGLRSGRYDRGHGRSYRAGDYKAYQGGDQVYRNGFVAGYDEGFGRQGNPAYQSGYNEGLRSGRYDRDHNRSYRAGDYKAYQEGDQGYRDGFVAGYDEGFGRGR